jgi:hypothetical protein
MQTVTRFCYSADLEIGLEHVPYSRNWQTWSQAEITEVKTLAVHFAQIAWADISKLSRQAQLPTRLLPQAVPDAQAAHREGLHHDR